eukprot:scaffold2640_cov256-Chaetoceros_neogracile.AAC.7
MRSNSVHSHNRNHHQRLIMTFATAAFFLAGRSSAFVSRPALSATRSMSAFSRTGVVAKAEEGQAEVVLVGCGAPNRGMGWYHGLQMVEQK